MSYAAEARSAAITAIGWIVSYDLDDWRSVKSIPTNVPVDATRKTRNGNVRALKEGYRRLAPITAAAPIPVPMIPPIDPPLTVAL
jgi:hypothetical protein